MCDDDATEGSQTREYADPAALGSYPGGPYDGSGVVGGPYDGIGGSGAAGIIGIIDIGIPRPVFLTNCAITKPRTMVMANFDKIKALTAFRPMRATKIGIRAFIFSFMRSRTGKRSFFLSRPRAVRIKSGRNVTLVELQ